jgi:hypothetical protein
MINRGRGWQGRLASRVAPRRVRRRIVALHELAQSKTTVLAHERCKSEELEVSGQVVATVFDNADEH